MGSYSTLESELLSSDHHRERRRAELAQQRAYTGLDAARRAAGVARLVMGVHLVGLHDSEGWRGRTGAKSFRRFLLEDGIEPKAAHQYMTVARAFVLEHGVSPESIALVGMRVLVDAARYLRHDDPAQGIESNVSDIVAIVTSLPSAEAHQALLELFSSPSAAPVDARLSRPVYRILNAVDGLTLEQRSELYQVLRTGTAASTKSPADAQPQRTATQPVQGMPYVESHHPQ